MFLRRQVKWHLFKNFPQFIMIIVNRFSIVNEKEVDVFLELPCFLSDPTNVGNLISGPSAFSKPSLYTWKFLVHVLLKPSLKYIELHLTSTRVFLGGSDDREPDSNAGNLSSGPWVRKIRWRRGMATHSSALPGEIHKQRSLADYSLWGPKESDTTEQLKLSLSLISM